MERFRLLFLGDVVGEPGIRAVTARLPDLVRRTGAHLVVANGENGADGLGITAGVTRDLERAGVGVITTGNHVWRKRAILKSIGDLPRMLRPANYPPGAPGRGWCVVEAAGVAVGVLNLCGQVFMDPLDCPFRAADRALEEMSPRPPVILVDFHAEATSEKRALGWYLDGRVTAVVGTHTHVPTADAQILPRGTGYITDVGMTGVADSVIGMSTRTVMERFLTRVNHPLGVASGEATVCGALLEADPRTGRCLRIERIQTGPGPGA